MPNVQKILSVLHRPIFLLRMVFLMLFVVLLFVPSLPLLLLFLVAVSQMRLFALLGVGGYFSDAQPAKKHDGQCLSVHSIWLLPGPLARTAGKGCDVAGILRRLDGFGFRDDACRVLWAILS